jgi:hypothetical protein
MFRPALALATVATLAGCAGNAPMMARPYDASMLPTAVQVPAGNRIAMETVGKGRITYECRVKANTAGEHEWFFVGPDATLMDRSGRMVGRYYGPPATWESTDGSRVTATQLAVAPAAAGNIPLQLVKANPATGSGAMNGITYIQRVNTVGGVAPTMPCNATSIGTRQIVDYQADYILYKAM